MSDVVWLIRNNLIVHEMGEFYLYAIRWYV